MTQNSDGLSIPIPKSQGGTEATTGPAALVSLGALPIAGGTMTGNLILNADPTIALGAATKQYVDAISSGLSVKQSAYAATTANLTASYANGAAGVGATLTNTGAQVAFSTDGTTPPLNARILVKDEATGSNNGVYVLSDQGSGATNWILTRATDFDQPAEIGPGAFVIVNNGTLWATTSWIETDTVATVGTDPIAFSQFTGGVGANITLSNLSAATAINQDLLPAADITQNIGADNLRFDTIFAVNYNTGIVNGDEMLLSGYNTGAADYTDFLTITAGATATAVLDGSITSTTQAPLTSNTTLSTTAYTDAAVSASGGIHANQALSNLSLVAINDSLTPGVDGVIDLGDAGHRWADAYIEEINTGIVAGETLILSGFDTKGAVFDPFFTITAGNPPTAALASSVTASTQAALDNSSKIATTAYVDSVGSLGANKALSNLSTVAINTALSPGADGTIDLGTLILRYRDLFAQRIKTGNISGNTLLLQAYNTGGASYTTFATLTAGPTPTMALDGAVMGVTQAPGNNSTALATTAYADASAGAGANAHLSNLSAVAVNSDINPGTDNTNLLGSGVKRWLAAYIEDIRSGTTNTNVLTLSGFNTTGSTYTPFITITTATTATAVIASGVTATTQTPADNTNKLATTAYSDAGTATRASLALDNLAVVAINTSLVPAADGSINLGSAAKRFLNALVETVQTGTTNGNSVLLQAYNTGGASYTTFATLTAGATPTFELASAVTATTQTPLTSNTTLSTTAYVDAAVTAAGGGANTALSNLAAVAINTALLPGVDNTIDLGSASKRFRNGLIDAIQTGTSNGQTTLLQAYNTNTAGYVTFATMTANNPPTLALGSAVTATTQSALTANTTIATTAYVDSAVTAGTPAKVDQTTTPVTMVANTIYSANNAGLVTLNIPAVAPFGSTFTIIGTGSGGWKVVNAAGQTVNFGNLSTTTGVGGSLASVNRYDCITIFCTVANTTFTAYAPQGNITIV